MSILFCYNSFDALYCNDRCDTESEKNRKSDRVMLASAEENPSQTFVHDGFSRPIRFL